MNVKREVVWMCDVPYQNAKENEGVQPQKPNNFGQWFSIENLFQFDVSQIGKQISF